MHYSCEGGNPVILKKMDIRLRGRETFLEFISSSYKEVIILRGWECNGGKSAGRLRPAAVYWIKLYGES
jgi:hypothetical protein